jgi:hypothetical protein
MAKKKKSVFEQNKEEIIFKIIQSALGALLVFFGGLTALFTVGFTWNGFAVTAFSSLITGTIFFLTKMKEYLDTQENEYTFSPIQKCLNII